MASLIPGYNYDIFISYRQKDNKYDGWVTEFVNHLKAELESTFKEDISVYFDINPHDGLLETHDVDASLKDKLKCLIFIPIISRTYCDPRSFAWELEFKAFVEQASQDQFGFKVKLPNGNVANRVLPVRIHDLDEDDLKLCEFVLGGFLRGVEFIYKEPGVNRPLRLTDNEVKNMNHTNFRNQINKVALSVKEIISGLKKEPGKTYAEIKDGLFTQYKPQVKEKSIIVLPFENISPDPDQEYFSDGLTEEIITDLSHIHDLLVISRSSAMTFKGTKKKTGEIANEVNVKYVLEGSVRKSGNNLRITAQLIDGSCDSHIWAEKYLGTMDDIFEIQEKVSGSIAHSLKLKLSNDERPKIGTRHISDPLAYELYLKSKKEVLKFTKEGLDNASLYLNAGQKLIGENVLLLAGLGYVYYQYVNIGIWTDEKSMDKIDECAQKIFDLEPDSPYGNLILGLRTIFWKYAPEGVKLLNKVISHLPNDFEALGWICAICATLGKKEAATTFAKRLMTVDPLNYWSHLMPGTIYYWAGDFKEALNILKKGSDTYPEEIMFPFMSALSFACNHEFEKSCSEFKKLSEIIKGSSLGELCDKYIAAMEGNLKEVLEWHSPETMGWAWRDFQASFFVSQVFSIAGLKGKAVEWLEHAVDLGMINYPFLKERDPLLHTIRGEERFSKLMERVKYEWENFEV